MATVKFVVQTIVSSRFCCIAVQIVRRTSSNISQISEHFVLFLREDVKNRWKRDGLKGSDG